MIVSLYVDSLPTNSNLSNSLLTTEGQQSAENNKPQTNFIMSDDGLVQRSADEAAARSSNILGTLYCAARLARWVQHSFSDAQ